MITKHTKGRWYLQDYTDAYTHIVRCDAGEGFETLMVAYTPQSMCAEARANAKLMAAAPDLLAACIKQKALMNEAGMIDKDLNAAIKKATE